MRAPLALAPSPTPSIPAVAVPLAATQASPAPFPYESKVVEIESNEDSAEGPISKRLRPTMTTTSHSSTTNRSALLNQVMFKL